MKNRVVLLGCGFLVAWTFAISASAQSVPTVVNYQGRLTDNSPLQEPISETVEITFSIYGSLVGSDLLWTETWASVQVNDGIFSVLLGSNGSPIPASVFSGGTTRYLEIEVENEVLSPRQQLGAAGWAAQAEKASDSDSLGGLSDDNWQKRILGECGPGSYIRSIGVEGTVVCNPDQDTTYSTGLGLQLSGGSLSIDELYFENNWQRRVSDQCVPGSYIRSIDAAGSVICGIDQDTNYSAGLGLQLAGTNLSIDGFYFDSNYARLGAAANFSSVTAIGDVTISGIGGCFVLPNGGQLCSDATCTTLISPGGTNTFEVCD
jgi:hypothetical protein